MKKIFNSKKLKERRKDLRDNSTSQEIILWSRIKNKQTGYKFRRQHSIGGYIVDFYCPDKKLIIELDGSQHCDKNQRIYDKERTNYLESLGLKVIRFWDDDINNNLAGVLMEINKNL